MDASAPIPSQLPLEIWYIILLHAIEVTPYLATTVEGSYFLHQQSANDYKTYLHELEAQTSQLRLVCKSWNLFLDSQTLFTGSDVSRARRVLLSDLMMRTMEKPTMWEIVDFKNDGRDEAALHHFLEHIHLHPRVRRMWIEMNPLIFLHTIDLSKLVQLTYLNISCQEGDTSRRPRESWSSLSIITPNSVTLPYLEVLRWSFPISKVTPCDFMVLPSLRHFELRLVGVPLPASAFVPYTSSLISIYLQIQSTLYKLTPVILPDLTAFPVLKELSLSLPSAFSFDLPRSAALQTVPQLERMFYEGDWRLLPRAGFEELMSFDAPKLRVVRVCSWSWKRDHKGFSWLMCFAKKMYEMAELCKQKGVRLEDGQGKTRYEQVDNPC